jgi:hypothetical protein
VYPSNSSNSYNEVHKLLHEWENCRNNFGNKLHLLWDMFKITMEMKTLKQTMFVSYVPLSIYFMTLFKWKYYVVLSERMKPNYELERIWKETGTSRLRIEPRASQISRNANLSTITSRLSLQDSPIRIIITILTLVYHLQAQRGYVNQNCNLISVIQI